MEINNWRLKRLVKANIDYEHTEGSANAQEKNAVDFEISAFIKRGCAHLGLGKQLLGQHLSSEYEFWVAFLEEAKFLVRDECKERLSSAG